MIVASHLIRVNFRHLDLPPRRLRSTNNPTRSTLHSSPHTSLAMADSSVNQDSLTLEETNKVRISLGLAPIGGEVDADAPPDADEVAEQNFAKRQAEEKAARAEREVKERLDKVKNQRALHAKLKGSTLADENKDDALTAKNWIKTQKKRAARRERELAERRAREEEADRAAYGEEDLVGLKVAHAADEFEAGEDVILTLKDSRVLGGDEDELQNVNLVDYAADKAAKERKRKAQQAYTGYDDEEFEEGRIGKKADILGKYDGDFMGEGIKSEGFRLGAPIEKKPEVEEEESDFATMGQPAAQKVKLSADFATEWEVSDYMKEGDKGFKKKKKRPKHSTRRAEVDEDDKNAMEVDAAPTFAPRVVGDDPDNLVDDDDLQAALARSRRLNARKKPKVKPEDLAAQIAARREEEAADVKEEPEDEDGRITFDETSEFVRNVTTEPLRIKKERSRTRSVSAVPSAPAGAANGTASPIVVKVERVDEDEEMSDEEGDEDEDLAEMAAREGLSLAEYRIKIDTQMAELSEMAADGGGAPEPEPQVGQGVAGVLALLRNQGTLEKVSAEQAEREKLQKQHDLWLADYRRRTAERELERIKSRGGNKDQAQREYENRMREQREAREALEIFKAYKPDVNLKYHDEFGREMTPKEAWKSLSHKFHGKTSGRMKTEKRLRKIEEEKKAKAMLAGDTPLGMADAFARRAKKTGEAHMVLAAGNKGSVQADKKKRKE